ncbi:MAG: YeeE/YedE family protein [Deltaproteobacteria bacterium]|nr:YeeE/YedE family protein [Deltaproteobacteria bacterium]
MSSAEVTAAEQGAKEGAKFWNPYVAGTLLGVLLFLAFFITTHGLGASGGVGRLIVFFEDLFAPEHVNRTLYLASMAGGDRNPLDSWIVFAVLGTVLGGLASGLIYRRARFETFKGPRISPKARWLFALAGGIIMGYGARLARGCTSGQGLSGGATLSVGSWAFLFAIFFGGYVVAIFVRRLWR